MSMKSFASFARENIFNAFQFNLLTGDVNKLRTKNIIKQLISRSLYVSVL